MRKISNNISYKNKVKLKDIAITIPKTLQNNDIFLKEPSKCIGLALADTSDNLELIKTLSRQHPLINTWLACSSFAICFLYILLFIAT